MLNMWSKVMKLVKNQYKQCLNVTLTEYILRKFFHSATYFINPIPHPYSDNKVKKFIFLTICYDPL